MKGFTFFVPSQGIDVFIETTQQKKTDAFAGKVLQKLGWADIPQARDYLLCHMRKAECEIKTLSNGSRHYDIHGDGFGGYGSFVGDGKTMIVKI